MDLNFPALACVALITFFFVIPWWVYIEVTERAARRERDSAARAGRNQPVTIQPLINLGTCMGSGTCVTACPEDVLKIIDGQAVAVNMAACIGHGECVTACPVDAIELVFGSEKRGIDIPEVDGNFETNVPGLFVAGELGGMGLIVNAADQGVRAAESAIKGLKPAGRSQEGRTGLAIIGAGPAGIAAALTAKKREQDFVVFEQGEIGGAVIHYPRKKLVFTRTMELPIYGAVRMSTMVKEELVELFQRVVDATGLEVSTQERVDEIRRDQDGGFAITTSKRKIKAERVILAMGRRGTPRQLKVPGEDLDKVAYSLLEPEQYEHDHVLVVGGGDSAVEAACTLGEQRGTRVTLSYRGAKINRPKQKNVERLRDCIRSGSVELLLESSVREIGEDRVTLEQHGELIVLPNDYMFVFVGGILPTDFLRNAGVRIKKHFGKRVEEVGESHVNGDAPDLLTLAEAPAVGEPTRVLGEKTVQLPRALGEAPLAPGGLRPRPRPTKEPAQGAREDVGDPLTAAVDFGDDLWGERTRRLPAAADLDDETRQMQRAPFEEDEAIAPGTLVASSPMPQGQLRNIAFGKLPSGANGNGSASLIDQVDRAFARLQRGDLDGAERGWSDALQRAKAASNPVATARAHHGLAHGLTIRGQLPDALAELKQAATLLARSSDPALLAIVMADEVELHLATGGLADALARGQTLLDHVIRQDLTEHRATALSIVAYNMASVGYKTEATEVGRQAVAYATTTGPLHNTARERAARALCDVGQHRDADDALRSLPKPDENSLDDPAGQRLALQARVAASTDVHRGRDLAEQTLARATPLYALRAARILHDAGQALLSAGANSTARQALKRGLKVIHGTRARGLKLELMLGLNRASPDDRVAEAAAAATRRIMQDLPSAAKKAFVARPAIKAVLSRAPGRG